MVNFSVGSVFYRGRLALIFLSLYHKIAATSILWYNEEKIISERGHLHENFSSRLRRQPHRPRHLRPHRVPDFPITPQITVKARDKVAARVCEVAKEIEAELIVIGLPLNMDGTEGERARKSRKLAKTVEIWSGLPVRMWDERQTTCAAADLLDESGTFGAKRKSILDSVSATVILDDYLAWRKEHPGRSERPCRPCGKVSLRSPDSLLQSPQKNVVFRFVFTIFLGRICIVFRLDSTGSSPIE